MKHLKKSFLPVLMVFLLSLSLPPIAAAQFFTQEEVDEVVQKAKAGDPESMWSLSVLYQTGYGLKKNEKAAREWLEKAAEGGFVKALSDLSRTLKQEGNETEAFKYARLAAQKGGDSEKSTLGDFYLDGIGTAKDLNAAANWYKAAGWDGRIDLMEVDLQKYKADDHRWIHLTDDTDGNSYYYLPQSSYKLDDMLNVLVKKVHTSARTENLYQSAYDEGIAEMGAEIEPTRTTYDQEIRGYSIDCTEREWTIERTIYLRGSQEVYHQNRTSEDMPLGSRSILQDLVRKYCKS